MSAATDCPVCAGAKTPFARISGFTLARCSSADCGHVWVVDGPSGHELERRYDTSESLFENTHAFQLLADYERNPEAVRRYYTRDRIRHIERRFPSVLVPGAAVLDVGCSSGAFLATLRDAGVRVHGQDVAVQAVRIGREALGLDLRETALSTCRFGTTFDLVTCYDVIEHCRDAGGLLRQIHAHVCPDGRLVIRTPNHSGWLLGLTRRNWLWYIPPAHQHYFNPRSLALLLERSGFRVESIRTDASTYLYLMRHYLFPAGNGVSLDMPPWKERLAFGLDDLVRLAACVPLAIAARRHWNPVLEIYARAQS